MSEILFSFNIPMEIVFGKGVSNQVGHKMKSKGLKKALIVTDKGIVNAGLLEKIQSSLHSENIDYFVFDEVPPNPPASTVMQGASVYKDNNCDFLIAVGGGSVMDSCKCIGMIVENEGDILEYDIALENTREIEKVSAPTVMIPTTAGTGSEVNFWAVITDEHKHVKASIGATNMYPVLSLVDPEMTLKLPQHITAATGMDALTHAIEAYTARSTMLNSSPLTEAIALKAIQLISENIRQSYAKGYSYESRENMMLGSMMASMAFSNSGLGNTHSLAHPLGGHYDIPHGVANAILLPYVMEFNLSACPEKFQNIAIALGENVEKLSTIEAAHKAIKAVKSLSNDLNIPALKTFNIPENAWPELAEDALNDPNTLRNPRVSTLQDMLSLYEKAYYSDL
jgi:alcohol dehydrogenase class IV